jgi:hypothetical protein
VIARRRDTSRRIRVRTSPDGAAAGTMGIVCESKGAQTNAAMIWTAPMPFLCGQPDCVSSVRLAVCFGGVVSEYYRHASCTERNSIVNFLPSFYCLCTGYLSTKRLHGHGNVRSTLSNERTNYVSMLVRIDIDYTCDDNNNDLHAADPQDVSMPNKVLWLLCTATNYADLV